MAVRGGGAELEQRVRGEGVRRLLPWKPTPVRRASLCENGPPVREVDGADVCEDRGVRGIKSILSVKTTTMGLRAPGTLTGATDLRLAPASRILFSYFSDLLYLGRMWSAP